MTEPMPIEVNVGLAIAALLVVIAAGFAIGFFSRSKLAAVLATPILGGFVILTAVLLADDLIFQNLDAASGSNIDGVVSAAVGAVLVGFVALVAGLLVGMGAAFAKAWRETET
ncbi:hypothetical protein RXV86_18165 [Alisedimentitalea sp. MJ-SS2]|uniref:hypothetical protein n=1 Tax=Aliisedimentitalea sp. MJ-SS2 TaxID=3049795 RepID=UPI0029140E0A|nr:hypothetical protein [Alisedimentitalea sp. MJ-SS2]MDU8929322.1 hypothetical protein [Alisedimentitalea sp. MJ-SS2]